MELNMRISAYLPAIVRRYLEKTENLTVPATHSATVVCMFADVSGFTSMTENLAIRGPSGAESLGKYLNSYLEQVLKITSSGGGDVFKFAGDALIVLWCENKEDTMETLARRCIQCALEIQTKLREFDFSPGICLSTKIGIGVGRATVAHLGGESDGATSRIEYIGVGPAFIQAFNAEHHSNPGEVICSEACWQLISPFFTGRQVKDSDYFVINSSIHQIRNQSRRSSFTRDDVQLQGRMQRYVSRAVWPYLDEDEEFWGSELREVTVLFINTGFGEDELSSTMLDTTSVYRLHATFAAVQRCIFDYEGTINKFLVDDKGSTIIAVFGMPPVCHENDPVRGILASLAICAAIEGLGLKASIGVTTGTAFCGVVGHPGNRREYTVLGDIVNLAARLMQRAKSEKGGVLTDERTRLITKDVLHFEDLVLVPVKGKLERIKINRPYVRQSVLAMHHKKKQQKGSGVSMINNLHGIIHSIQVQYASEQLGLTHEEEVLERITMDENPAAFNIQESIQAKVASLNLLSPTGAILLEGGIGLGKTRLVKSALRGVPNVYYAAATPFRSRDYGVFASILKESRGNVSIEEWVERGVGPQTHWLNQVQVLYELFDEQYVKPSNQEGNNDKTSQTEPQEATLMFMEQFVADLQENQDDMNEDGEEFGERESLWSPTDLDNGGILILSALYAISREKPLVIVLDNAMYMDEKSWIVAISMAKYFTNCLLVVVSRPPSGAITQRTASSAFRKQLRALKVLPSTTHCVMDRLYPEQVEAVAARILKVQNIPADLSKVLYSRSQGNPLFLHELIKEMVEQKVLLVNGNTCETRVQEAWGDKAAAKYCFDCPAVFSSGNTRKRCKVCGYIFCLSCAPNQCYKKPSGPARFDTPIRHCKICYGMTPGRLNSFERAASESKVALGPVHHPEKKSAHRKVKSIFSLPTNETTPPPPKHRTALAPPRLLKSVLVTLLDQLTHSQYMLMRTASFVGVRFEIKVVKEIYPIKTHLHRFDEDLEELTRLSMVRPVDVFIGGLKDHVPKKYEFCHGFMHDVIMSQMLSVQCDKLESKLSDYRKQKEKEMRQIFFEKSQGILPHYNSASHGSLSITCLSEISQIPRAVPEQPNLCNGFVYVKKHSSIFRTFLRGAAMWKRRRAILHNSKLLLQHESNHGGRCTIVELHGARVRICDMTHDPAAFKYHCLLLEVQEWTRIPHEKPESLGPRDFVLGVENVQEMDKWIYMFNFAIESLSSS